jgi:hypothetical protein
MLAHEEVFERRILSRIRWLEIVHIDAVEVYEAYYFLVGVMLAFLNPSFCVPVVPIDALRALYRSIPQVG